jgi:hypothetical protein
MASNNNNKIKITKNKIQKMYFNFLNLKNWLFRVLQTDLLQF